MGSSLESQDELYSYFTVSSYIYFSIVVCFMSGNLILVRERCLYLFKLESKICGLIFAVVPYKRMFGFSVTGLELLFAQIPRQIGGATPTQRKRGFS